MINMYLIHQTVNLFNKDRFCCRGLPDVVYVFHWLILILVYILLIYAKFKNMKATSVAIYSLHVRIMIALWQRLGILEQEDPKQVLYTTLNAIFGLGFAMFNMEIAGHLNL